MARIDIWDAHPMLCWAITALIFISEVAFAIGFIKVVIALIKGG